MREPKANLSAERLLHNGDYLEAALEPNPKTKHLAEAWSLVQTTLRDAESAAKTAFTTRIKKRAALVFSDVVLDNAVRKTRSATEVDAGNVNNPELAKLWRIPPGALVALPFQREIDEVKAIEKVIAEGALWKTAKAALPELTAARTAAEAALGAYTTARRAHRDAQHAVDDARDDWRRSYRANYGAIVQIFPDDKRLQESFFYRESEADTGDSHDDEPTTPPAPPAPATTTR